MRRRLLLGSVLLAILFLYCWHLGARSFWEPDEPRYAEIGREMLVTGDWVVPRLNFLKYYEKPPLAYWSVACSFAFFGISEGSARLGPMIAALLFLGGTWVLGRAVYDRFAATIGTLILALSPLAWITGRLLLTDIFLAAGVVWALAGHACAWDCKARGRSPVAAMAVSGLGLAIAWLAKGPIGLLIPLFGVIPARIMGGKAASIGRRGWAAAMAILVLLGAPWFTLICMRDPAFAPFFFIHEHVLRYLTPEANREGPLIYYFVVLFAGLFPASVLIPWAARKTWPGLRPDGREGRGTLLLGCAGILTLIFFTASHSKLVTYILPAAPAFALVTGRAMALVLERGAPAARTEGGRARGAHPAGLHPQTGALQPGLRVSLAVASAFSAAGGAAVGWLVWHPLPSLDTGSDLFLHVCVFVAIAAGLGVAALRGTVRSLRGGLLASGAAGFLGLLGLELLGERLDSQWSVKTAARYVAGRAERGDIVAAYGSLLQGLTYYTQRRTVILDGAGELRFGADDLRSASRAGGKGASAPQPGAVSDDMWILGKEALPRLLDGRRVYVVLRRSDEGTAIRGSRGTLRPLLQGPRFSVFSNEWEYPRR